ncbi:MAG TPA: alpha/beta fold hydrolase [Kiritimatiellia bacterium]|nr:alpha/beta fold hydrolase [Kiritimatiellia bacterium]HMO98512.1 alpha/beta fold hydrolase [Kiritimatiellia bacterium]HMP95820.1 alpha/beta fold hydrolase [Kiritimatiellia bacterium]
MTVHLISGWSFPAMALQPLAEALAPWPTRRYDAAQDTSRIPVEADDLLIGWSLGGLNIMARRYARASCGRGIVLIGSTARFCRASDYDAGVEPSALRSMRSALRRGRRDMMLTHFYEQAGFQNPQSWCLAASGIDDETLDNGLRELEELDARDDLRDGSTPALILHGEHDRIIPVAAAHWLARELSQAAVRIHPAAGHDLPLTHPDWVAEQIRDYFTR